MTVVDDSAEQSIALMNNFNTAQTTKEEGKKFLLKAVFVFKDRYDSPNKQMKKLMK